MRRARSNRRSSASAPERGRLGVVVGALVAANGTLAHAAPALGALAVAGVALVANGTLRLPGWAAQVPADG